MEAVVDGDGVGVGDLWLGFYGGCSFALALALGEAATVALVFENDIERRVCGSGVVV